MKARSQGEKGMGMNPSSRPICALQLFMSIMLILPILSIPLLFFGCSNGKSKVPPVYLAATVYTYALEEGTDAIPLWTTPCTHKLQAHERAPDETRSGLFMSAARGEFEPVQLLLGPGSGEVEITVDDFQGLGSGQRIELAAARYDNGWAEQLDPLEQGAAVSMSSDHAVPVWITVRVPDDAPAGETTASIRVKKGGSSVDVPVTLHVFDFSLPAETHYSTMMNLGVGDLVPGGGDVEDAKDMLFEHRLTPTNVTWPSGFGWGITWDNPASPDRCEAFWDEPDEPDEYSIGWLARRYILGEGWNGVGFPDAELFQFVDNSTPRPDELCGVARGDHYGTAAYNAEWSQFLAAVDGYVVDNGYEEKAYYYVQNEPQDDEDHALAAHLCRLSKAAAPHLRIAVSEEPKPEIAEDSGGECGYDLWIAHVRAYQQGYAWERQEDHGEEVWLYSLDQDPDPYFNPTMVEADGINQRIIPWVSWTLRATGWAYYDAGRFFDGAAPTIRAELLREGIEDYEYLYLANDRAGGGSQPRVNLVGDADVTAASAASSLTSWTRDVDALMALRHELGRYIEGARDDPPVLEASVEGHPRAAYRLNFQDPDGPPAADPLEIGGETWMKVGWAPYDDDAMFGWYGEFIDDAGIALYGYDDVAGYDEAQRSYLYDDYGRDNLFEFALENGDYEVTVGAGRPGHGYPNDPHNVTVEGIPVIEDEPTSDAEPVFTRTVAVTLTDGRLSVEMGGLSELTGEWAYTFLAYVAILPVD